MSRRLRRYCDEDRERCLAIYRANLNAGLIPNQYEGEFLNTLAGESALTLVLEVEGELIGCGSVGYSRESAMAGFERYSACLSFGLIHPNYQRKKWGSYLLVGRLALLSESGGICEVCLSAIEGSVGFYAGVVGFSEVARNEDEYGNHFFELSLMLNARRLQDAREYLSGGEIDLEAGLKVPVTDLSCPIIFDTT